MSGGGGSSNTTTVQKADPWGPTQAPLSGIAIPTATQLFSSGRFSPAPFAGDRVADFTGMQQQGFGMAQNVMGQPNAASAGQGSLINMLSGDDGIYRDLDTVKQEALGSAIPAAVAQFSGNGMTDSSAAMDTVGRAATEAVAPIDYQAYLAQQQNQLRAAALAPSVDAGTYLPAQMGLQFGGIQQQQGQNEIDALMSRYYEGATRDRDNLLGYTQMLLGAGGVGGTASSTAPGASTGSRVAGAAGGALGGAAMGSALGPYGAAAGGLIGLMGGLFR